MTTAFLSVGIKTDSAFAALRQLRDEVQRSVNLSVAVDPASIDRSIQGYLKQRTFKIGANTKALRDDVNDAIEMGITDAFKKQYTLRWNHAAFMGGITSAMDSTFGQRRRLMVDHDGLRAGLETNVRSALNGPFKVGIDEAALSASVRAAVGAGAVLAAGAAPGAVSAPAAAAFDQGAMIRTVGERVQAILVSPLDRMSKAADQLAALSAQVVRVGRAVDASGTQNKRSKVGGSVLDPETGLRKSYSQTLDGADAVRAEAEVRRAAEIKLQVDKEAQARKEAQQAANEAYRARRNWQRAMMTEEQRAVDEAQRTSNETFRARRNWARAQSTAERQAAADAQRTSNETFRARRSWQRAQDAADQQAAAEAQRSSNETFRARRTWARAQDAAERQAAAEAQRTANETWRTRQNWHKAEQAALKAQMASLVSKATFERGDSYTTKGKRVLAADTLLKAGYSEEQVSGFIRNQAVMMAALSGQLDTYRRDTAKAGEESKKSFAGTSQAVKALTNDTAELRRGIKEGHDAARGFAGAMGQIWLTWGSLVPLAAGAAIGATLRSAVTAGKELEYQLEFVKVLSDGIAVSNQDLGSVAVGAMVRPTEAAQGLRGLAQNGLSAREALQALPDILNLAAAGEMALGEAALGATGVMAAFNLHVEDLGRVGDVFAMAASESNTSVTSMVEAMKQASTVADQYQVSLEETAATLAVMAKRNIEGSAAGTAFRNMMVELASPTDQAKRAMQALGLEVFDASGKMKPYVQIMKEIRDATVVLNQESRVNVLNTIFGERGGKAANALLSDMALFDTLLSDLTSKSKGFAQSVTDALGQTTEGQWKRLIGEFEMQTAEAFEQSKGSVDSLVASLRELVQSEAFTTGVSSLVANFSALSATLVEHRDVVAFVVEVYGAYYAAGVANELMNRLGITTLIAKKVAELAGANATKASTTATVAATAAQAAMTAATNAQAAASARAAVYTALATAGLSALIGVVAMAGAEYLLFKNHSDEAAQAQEATTRAIAEAINTIDRNIDRLAKQNEELALRNQLMNEGLSYEEAKAAAAKRLESKGESRAIETTTEALDQAKRERSDVQKKIDGGSAEDWDMLDNIERKKQLDEKIRLLEYDLQKQGEYYRKAREQRQTEEANRRSTAADANRRDAEAFNRQIDSVINGPRFKGDKTALQSLKLPTDEEWARSGSAREQIEKAKQSLNSSMERVTVVTQEALAASRALENAKAQLSEQRMRNAEKMLKLEVDSYQKIAKAKYDAAGFGRGASAAANELIEIDARNRLISMERAAISQLEADKARASAVEKIRIQQRIEAREDNIKTMMKEWEVERQVSQYRAQGETREMNEQAKSDIDQLAAQQTEAMKELARAGDRKYIPADEVARAAAEAKAWAEAQSVITRRLSEVKATQDAINKLESDAMAAGPVTEEQARVIDQERVRLALQEAIVENIRAQTSEFAKQRGDLAAMNVQNGMTADAGWERFWNEYRQAGKSAADDVYGYLKFTTDGMQSMVSDFVLTGKFKWREFGASIIAEAARIMAHKAVMGMLNMFMSMIGSSYSYNDGVGTTNAAGISGGRASGGPMTAGKEYYVGERGPERIKLYPGGGGYVTPTQDVYRSAGAPAATNVVSNQQIHAEVHVTVNSDGSSKTKTQGDADARKLAEQIKAKVIEVITDQQRSGGILEKTR